MDWTKGRAGGAGSFAGRRRGQALPGFVSIEFSDLSKKISNLCVEAICDVKNRIPQGVSVWIEGVAVAPIPAKMAVGREIPRKATGRLTSI